MKTHIVIQARMGSTRLPGKILKPLCGLPMLEQIVERAKKCNNVDEVIVATSDSLADDVVQEFCEIRNYKYFRGSEKDVLDRFYKCTTEYKSELIIRMTADNALFDPSIIDEGIEYYMSNSYDYVYYAQGMPLGTAIELFSYEALSSAWREAVDDECREHVTLFMYRSGNKFKWNKPQSGKYNHENIRLTTDTEEDYRLVKEIYEALYPINSDFTLDDVLQYISDNPTVLESNKHVKQKVTNY
ncbi:MAG: glycosyltransferase family protein [Lachnospiraceae bacterium]|nr:glycosyltransferase family protein [Lachnospiraceae bacterium]MBP3595246.1 glycosyltransferase family protein [Lachnospiraceae bacterium]